MGIIEYNIDSNTPMLTFHHVGCAVSSIEAALVYYRPLFPEISAAIPVASQGVNVCFVTIGPGARIELIEPAEGNSMVTNLVRRGFTFYHVAFTASDFDAAVEIFSMAGYRPQEAFRSEAFDGKRCCFLINPIMHIIELIEA